MAQDFLGSDLQQSLEDDMLSAVLPRIVPKRQSEEEQTEPAYRGPWWVPAHYEGVDWVSGHWHETYDHDCALCKYRRAWSPENWPPPDGGESDGAGSRDPNDKLCPAGFGTNNFILPQTLMPYTIRFENETNATAPAQQVTVVDRLPAGLDWSTFELAELGFGDTIIPVPAHSLYFETNVPMSYLGTNFEVHIQAGINLANGQVSAQFYSIDPDTGLPPAVHIGFLPPEDGTGRGQGRVSFIIRAKSDLATGTVIRNVAEISFDNQAIIRTDQIDPHDPSKGYDFAEGVNTIDGTPPACRVLVQRSISSQTNLVVSWSGTDDAGGSGIASFDIYTSTDGGPWTLWLGQTTDTSAVFTGAWNHSNTVSQGHGARVIGHDSRGNWRADRKASLRMWWELPL